MTIALPKAELSGDLKDLDEKVKTMIGRQENMINIVQQACANHMFAKYVEKRVNGSLLQII